MGLSKRLLEEELPIEEEILTEVYNLKKEIQKLRDLILEMCDKK